ncbi:hypothetical protein HGO38_18645 [Rhizobium sp. CG5]|uniref:hypothetical protein n=1 Tax=Rhizobium sp. CG5 TaxID=2726076 RepID=UPI002033E504|nr:hypothetical protein [Rhizobium sp. CG5]MCM2475504.1 hypothetical protein [Rhizobium sp. CG5]
MSVTQYVLRSAIVLAMLSPAIPASAALNGELDTGVAGTTRLAQPYDLVARKGADDKPGHTRRGRGRDDGPNHTFLLKLDETQVARRGADDKPGHNRRGRGSDDAAGDDHGGRRA